MRYMILGGGGVFGINTAKYLLKLPSTKKVFCVGRNLPKAEPFSLNVGKDDLRYGYAQCHIGYEPELFWELFLNEEPDVIINIAAQGEGAVSWENSWRFFDTNATALARIVERVAMSGRLKRWIQIGSSEIYGSMPAPATETSPFQPTSPYAASKAAADMYLMALAKHKKFPVIILRPSNAYGPGQQLHRVIPKAVLCGLTGQKMPLNGGGKARKSYIHTDDLAQAIHLVSTQGLPGEIYNVGPEFPISIVSVVGEVANQLGMRLETLCAITPPRAGEDSQYWLDSAKIIGLGWLPIVGLSEGITEVISWVKEYLPELRKLPMRYVLHA